MHAKSRNLHKFLTEHNAAAMSSSTSTTPGNTSEADAPTTHSENAQLSHFRIETIQNDDKMVSFYFLYGFFVHFMSSLDQPLTILITGVQKKSSNNVDLDLEN